MVSAYNHAFQYKAELSEIVKDAPGALPVHASLVGMMRLPAECELLRLRWYLKKQHLPERIWKLALRDGKRVIGIVNQFYRSRDGVDTLEVLRILAGLQVERCPDEWMIQAIWGTFGNSAARREEYLSRIGPHLSDLAHLVRVFPAHGRPTAQDEYLLSLVVDYLTVPERPHLDRRQRQQGWPWLVKVARDTEAMRDQIAREGNRVWQVPFDTIEVCGYRFKALHSTTELVKAGKALRNCVGQLTDRFVEGDVLLAYITGGGGRRVGAAQFIFSFNGWCSQTVLGPMNREVPRDVERAADLVAGMIPVSPELKKRFEVSLEDDLPSICTKQIDTYLLDMTEEGEGKGDQDT